MAPPRRNPVDAEGLNLLRQAGHALFGERWYAGMARSLGLHSPSSGLIDASLVRKWDLGLRSMPPWVIARLRAAIADQDQAAVDRIREIEAQRREFRVISEKIRLRDIARTHPLDEGPPDDEVLGRPEDYRKDMDDPDP